MKVLRKFAAAAVILAITAGYVTGSFIVRANYGLGLLKPRDK